MQPNSAELAPVKFYDISYNGTRQYDRVTAREIVRLLTSNAIFISCIVRKDSVNFITRKPSRREFANE